MQVVDQINTIVARKEMSRTLLTTNVF